MNYVIRKTLVAPPVDTAVWPTADVLKIQNFRPESSAHRPATSVRLLYDRNGLHGQFAVQDRFVRCVRTNYLDEVWKDSCVEFFVRPKAAKGYFNFEFNCGGTFLCSYVTDWARTPQGFKEFVRVPWSLAQNVKITSSLPKIIEPEITEPVNWGLQFFVPFALLEAFVGPIGDAGGQSWTGNFFKCAEENSHPHWAAWSPVDEFNFHLPRCFGTIQFAADGAKG